MEEHWDDFDRPNDNPTLEQLSAIAAKNGEKPPLNAPQQWHTTGWHEKSWGNKDRANPSESSPKP